MLRIASSALLLLQLSCLVSAQDSQSSVLTSNLLDGCVVDFEADADIDYFPTKYSKPIIKSYGDRDIFGEKFVPHNTTDFLDISYHKTYKIVTNLHQDPPKKYLLYQCGTEIPQDVVDAGSFDLVVPVPHKGGLALTETPQIPYVELLGLRDDIVAYIGNPKYVTSPCMGHMMGEEAVEGRGTSIEVVYNFSIQDELIDDFRERHPEAIIVSGPSNNVVGEQVVVSSATQERTNVATFDWIAFFAAFYNMEGESNRIVAQMKESYDCSSDVAKFMARESRDLAVDEDAPAPPPIADKKKEPTIMWANYFTYQDLQWSVGECPTWDTSYYCEYAKHCGATVLTRPAGVGMNMTWGSPTVYWYLNDEEMLAMGKDADILIFSGNDWDNIYELKKDTLDQMKAVRNQQVFDTLGQGPSAWLEQRYAEYDVVGLDMCDIVGRAPTTGPKHERRWFRNVFTEPVGSLGECDVKGGEISKPYVPPQQECVRPPGAVVGPLGEKAPKPPAGEVTQEAGEADALESAAASPSSSLVGLVSILAAIAYLM
eukprot:CAMPEP_0168193286 /NCGR_PEP_ID=MMETSP0139_2-20121125/18521_1 /TAXON_ID=44445 /ORGANISM="Pseudo-nitzschia australis, Strain 10249 10 AB" /LENGTH=540 /DNA_ID=CAMNT_0008116623 /DNA_START=44 /DNA_END=1666 /DNA_ORIENTATION=+